MWPQPDDDSISARLARRRRSRNEGFKEEPDDEVDVVELVSHFKLSKFTAALQEMGVETSGDLAYLLDSDLEKIGMPMIPRRKLLEAAGGDWRCNEEHFEREPILPEQKCDQVMDDATEAEMRQLLAGWRDRVEDFSAANGVDGPARSMLSSLSPRAALRVMGLLGQGNAFVMQGVRRPSAAVLSRCRIAQREESQSAGRNLGLPYEDFPRLLECFITVNNLDESVRDSLRELDREQVLRVMGFTTGLRFIVQGDGSDANEEVSARIRAAVDGLPMAPAEPRIPATTSFGPCKWSYNRPRSRPREHGRMDRPRQNRQHPYVHNHTSQYHSQYPSQYSQHNSLHNQYHQYHHQHTGQFAAHNNDEFPFWRRNLETFIQVNELDERSVQALSELPKLYVLRVMGLVNRRNSFVIRGARNPNAAVMHRIAKAHEESGSDEPYAQIQKIVEDFISVNSFDAKGMDALRSLRKEDALHVMGFTADNAFLVRGVKNPSAALMARILAAKRSFYQD